jgi:hypothetical protein
LWLLLGLKGSPKPKTHGFSPQSERTERALSEPEKSRNSFIVILIHDFEGSVWVKSCDQGGKKLFRFS